MKKKTNDDRKNWDTEENSTRKAIANAEKEDDFLSGDNAKKEYPNNQNNPNRDYNTQSLSPNRNANIGGDESEYENSTSDADEYEEGPVSDNNDGFVDRRDNEEIDRHIDESRYSKNRSEE